MLSYISLNRITKQHRRILKVLWNLLRRWFRWQRHNNQRVSWSLGSRENYFLLKWSTISIFRTYITNNKLSCCHCSCWIMWLRVMIKFKLKGQNIFGVIMRTSNLWKLFRNLGWRIWRKSVSLLGQGQYLKWGLNCKNILKSSKRRNRREQIWRIRCCNKRNKKRRMQKCWKGIILLSIPLILRMWSTTWIWRKLGRKECLKRSRRSKSKRVKLRE